MTETPLAASGSFASAWFDMGSVSVKEIDALAVSDQTGTLYVDFSDDGGATTTVSAKVSIDAAPTSPLTVSSDYAHEGDLEVVLLGRYFRVRVVNGSTEETKLIAMVRVVTG